MAILTINTEKSLSSPHKLFKIRHGIYYHPTSTYSERHLCHGNLRNIARPALFIPESLYAKKVLELFKKNKNKFGVVVDKYGNTEGIITLHGMTNAVASL